jgi:hypothetical protein
MAILNQKYLFIGKGEVKKKVNITFTEEAFRKNPLPVLAIPEINSNRMDLFSTIDNNLPAFPSTTSNVDNNLPAILSTEINTKRLGEPAQHNLRPKRLQSKVKVVEETVKETGKRRRGRPPKNPPALVNE